MNFNNIRRLRLILEKLNYKSHTSTGELLDFLERHDIRISLRTLLRDIERLRTDHAIDVDYSKLHDGYFLSGEPIARRRLILHFFEEMSTAMLLKDSFRTHPDQVLAAIQFETEGLSNGAHQIRPLLDAIINRNVLEFEYHSHSKGEDTRRTAEPYLLKEYRKRWYLLAHDVDKHDLRIFGLDRIQKLVITGRRFQPDRSIGKSYFDDVFGITQADGTREQVKLLVSHRAAKLLRNVPLHHSQVIETYDERWVHVTCDLIPNTEFKNELRRLCTDGIVLEPAALAQEIRRDFEEASRHYAERHP